MNERELLLEKNARLKASKSIMNLDTVAFDT
jgi:hypothetical protein